MKIGIVGSSKAHIDTSNMMFVADIIESYPPDTIFVSGGADGIDKLVRLACELTSKQLIEYKPKSNNWEGYKKRNLFIATVCDEVISIVLPPNDKSYCYHCNTNKHEKSAGCWTARKCKKFRIEVLS